MVLGEDTTALWDQVANRMPKPAPPAGPTVTGAVAGAILPGAVVGLVDRHKHPFIWWAFGVIPLAWNGARLVMALGQKK